MDKNAEVNIYNGRDFWPDSVKKGLVRKCYGDAGVWVYEDMPGSLYESLVRTQARVPERDCLVDEDGTAYTYREFLELVNRFSEMLAKRYQVKPQMHVGILLYNSLEFCISVYALNRLGAVMVPLSTKYKKAETRSLMEMADLDGILFHEDFSDWVLDGKQEGFCICMNREELKSLPRVTDIPERKADAAADAVLMFTSGTTSRAKGVILKNYNIMHAVCVYQKIFEVRDTDKTVLPVPAYHITGLCAVIGLFVHAGGCIWLHKYFDAGRIVKEMQKNRLTFFHASPTALILLLEQRQKYPCLPDMRLIACGSANMPNQRIRDLKAWMPQLSFRTVYGLTETSSPATVFPEDASGSPNISSCGRPVPGLEFVIADQKGRALLPLETGSILVRGTTVTGGYYHREDGLLPGRWLDTGDIGYFNEDGYLFILDRKKDMINRGGEKICSIDVENAFCEIAGVKNAAVVGIPDEKYGEVPAAMVETEPGYFVTEESIREKLKECLAKYMIPVRIIFCRKLPMTANMKIDKKKIRVLLCEEKMP